MIGLDAAGCSKEVATLGGLVPRIRGVGESGQLSPGYDEALASARDVLGDQAYEHLTDIGRRMSLPDTLVVVDKALEGVLAH